jgi:hypothetical protein
MTQQRVNIKLTFQMNFQRFIIPWNRLKNDLVFTQGLESCRLGNAVTYP